MRMPAKTDDPDEALLEPRRAERVCKVARLIAQLDDPAQVAKVEAALAQPPDLVRTKNIAEYLRRKQEQPLHDDSVAKHRRGACGCTR